VIRRALSRTRYVWSARWRAALLLVAGATVVLATAHWSAGDQPSKLEPGEPVPAAQQDALCRDGRRSLERWKAEYPDAPAEQAQAQWKQACREGLEVAPAAPE
jgi:hypothetical protein